MKKMFIFADSLVILKKIFQKNRLLNHKPSMVGYFSGTVILCRKSYSIPASDA